MAQRPQQYTQVTGLVTGKRWHDGQHLVIEIQLKRFLRGTETKRYIAYEPQASQIDIYINRLNAIYTLDIALNTNTCVGIR